ncbi:MAG: hypothetical protein U0586_07920 [Candidatus Brocadiaceae bacterium]
MNIEITFSNQKDALMLSDPPAGVSVIKPPITITKGYGAEEIAVSVIIAVATGVPINLFTSWLYDKMKHSRSSKICINRKEIHLSQGEITKVIEETIKIKK